MKVTLFKLAIQVRPKPSHPTYWDWQWGWLLFWIYSEDFDSAAALATAIVKILPYEVTEENGGMRVFPVNKLKEYPPGHRNFEACRSAEYAANRIGIGMLLDAGATGCDDSSILTPFNSPLIAS